MEAFLLQTPLVDALPPAVTHTHARAHTPSDTDADTCSSPTHAHPHSHPEGGASTTNQPILDAVPTSIRIRQHSGGSIGSKLYPGALILTHALERARAHTHTHTLESARAHTHAADAEPHTATRADAHAPPTGSTRLSPPLHELLRGIRAGALVCEIGAGVCALPSIAAAALGAHVISTDMPDMLPLLSENVESSLSSVRAARARARTGTSAEADDLGVGTCEVQPLTWGVTDDVSRLRTRVAALRGAAALPEIIVAADVVYHEHLIEPLITALIDLTNVPDGVTAPPIVMAYVQRFKRAKDFFKKIRKWFDVECNDVGEVVDYDTLTWVLPDLMRRAKAGSEDAPKEPVYLSTSAFYSSYTELLYAAARSSTEAAGPAEAIPAVHAGPAASGAHAIDSDTDDEYSQGGAKTADRVFQAVRADGDLDDLDDLDIADASGRASDGGHGVGDGMTLARAAAITRTRLAEPLRAYLYVLRRKPARRR